MLRLILAGSSCPPGSAGVPYAMSVPSAAALSCIGPQD